MTAYSADTLRTGSVVHGITSLPFAPQQRAETIVHAEQDDPRLRIGREAAGRRPDQIIASAPVADISDLP